MRTRICALIATLVTGCTSLPNDAGAPSVAPSVRAFAEDASFRIFSPAQILHASSLSAYDAARKLRPGFFSGARLAGSSNGSVTPSAILESGMPEDLEVLKLVTSSVVASIEFVEPRDAIIEYGAAYVAGVVVVRLRRD